jgi:hypothetical protein
MSSTDIDDVYFVAHSQTFRTGMQLKGPFFYRRVGKSKSLGNQ